MLRRFAAVTITLCLSVTLVFLCTPIVHAEPPQSDDALWAGADERIEQYRKADAMVTVVDKADRPVSGAEVVVQQKRHAFLFGCNIFSWGRVGDEKSELEYRRRFSDVFNFATLPFYWQSYERQQGEPRHESTEEVAKWCKQQDIVCKGHPLAWNHSDPRWLPDDSQKILDLQLGRIDDCVRRFRDTIGIWDVVNEATHFDRAEFKKRSPKLTEMWSSVGQIEFTRQCFQTARKANGKATLLINDYRVDPAYVKLIEQLVDEDGRRLYDVIGIQSHQHGGTWTNKKIWEVCERFAPFDVPLHFTETTIVSGEKGWRGNSRRREDWPTTEDGETEQAREVERFYTMLYSHPAVEALTWWDFSDRGAWQGAPAGFLRKDMSPKPAYDVLHRLIKERWWTETMTKTDEQGMAGFRGSLGDYQITVKVDGKKVANEAMTVSRGDANQLKVRLPD